MWIFRFYRIFTAVAAGAAVVFFSGISLWIWPLMTVIIRMLWYFVEKRINEIRINRWFEQHSYEFKQQTGPYGIRLINQAENDPYVKKSICEVFTPDMKKLKEAVTQLETMDTLFKAGLQPQGDQFQLHDLKLKYGRYRLEKGS
jgi:hypothetical protein